MSAALARPELLATPDWLAQHLSRPAVRVIDCRYRVDGSARARYEAAHIPHAVFLDWAQALVAGLPPAPADVVGPAEFTAGIEAIGLGDGMTAVLYDDADSLYAAHVWCLLSFYGFRSVRILDGGWEAWERSGRPAASGAGPVERGRFTPRSDLMCRLSAPDVAALVGAPGVALVDARNPSEYRGESSSGERFGHIPGALNLPPVLLTDRQHGTFLPAAELARVVSRAGLRGERRVVTYDSTGVGAAKVAYALTLLGYPEVAVYSGGWSEWSARGDLPVEA